MTRIAPDWLKAPATVRVMEVLGEAYFVGGCVRDALLGRSAADIDISTPLLPEEVSARAEAAGLRVVPTGIAHGTVTVIADAQAFEVTTYRRDVETDGRRAVVAFSRDMAEDAARRDFTMNALYADAGGRVHDPLGGVEDLAAGHVRFIGDAAERIEEDYLRSLRFFRFYAWYGNADVGLDADGLAAVATHLEGLDRLSGERVGAEMKGLLSAPVIAPAVAGMAASGVLARILPGADPQFLGPLVHFEAEAGLSPGWKRRLAVLGSKDWADRLRLSKGEGRHLYEVRRALAEDRGLAEVAYRLGTEVALDVALVRGASSGGMPTDWQGLIAGAAEKVFPLKAADLMERYGPGAPLGAALKSLEAHWIAEEFRPDKAALLAIDRDTAV